jgi:tagatose 6-phosphate kinase
MILCLGTTPVYQRSMAFTHVTPDGVNRAKAVSDYASGKSGNVARVIHTLRRDVVATGFAGGSRGTMLLRDLADAGIRHDFVSVTPETRQCITVIDQSAGLATELVEESAAIEESAWRELDGKLRTLLPTAKVWVFSGTLPPAAPQDFYARWLPLAAQSGAIAIVDARGEPLRLAMKHPNGILKLNRDELAETLNADLTSDERLIEAIRQNTPANGKMIVTLGKGGAIGFDGVSCWRVFSPQVKAISAVGSGDAFAAGLAVGLADGKPFSEALKMASACGAANAMTARAGHLHLEEVDRLLADVRVQET